MVRDLWGWLLWFRRKISYCGAPCSDKTSRDSLSTGVHYDKLFLRDGGAYFLTVWAPLGDIWLDGGRLIYLSESYGLGQHIGAGFPDEPPALRTVSALALSTPIWANLGKLSDDARRFRREDP